MSGKKYLGVDVISHRTPYVIPLFPQKSKTARELADELAYKHALNLAKKFVANSAMAADIERHLIAMHAITGEGYEVIADKLAETI